jgi:hypothetical protein
LSWKWRKEKPQRNSRRSKLQDKSPKQFPNDWMILTNNQLVNHIRKKSMMDMFSVDVPRLERL